MTSLVRAAKLQAFTAGCAAAAVFYVYTKVRICYSAAGAPHPARFRPQQGRRRRACGGGRAASYTDRLC